MVQELLPNSRPKTALYGAIGGLYGSAAMSVVRLAARRRGLIDKMVPQAVEEWATARAGVEPPGGAAGHHILDQVMHLGYGAAAGALYGALHGTGSRRPLASGARFGGLVWLIGAGALFPLLNIARPLWRARGRENVVNLAAHLLYGISLQLVAAELSAPGDRRPTRDGERQAMASSTPPRTIAKCMGTTW